MEIKVRVGTGEKSWIGTLGGCNMHSLDEFIVYSDGEVISTSYSRFTDFEIDGVWHTKQEVEERRLLIPDNFNTGLFVPHSEAEREQGYNNY